jgi:cysteinyl-tRNA synthetase
MELKLYDTLTREKRVFAPIDPANVRMYVCGPTVYDYAHIGNARPVIVFDVLFRLLRHLYGAEHVTYVRNITDVDDKINARAVRDYPGLPLNDAIRKVTDATEAQFQADVKALGCLPPTYQPRATDFVLPRSDGRSDMKTLIQELLDRGNAYVAEGTEGKEILFDVSSMPDYGALSGRKLEDQKAGARIAVDAHKRNPGDFVLWKESGAKEPGWKGEFRPDPRSGYEAEFTISPEDALRLKRNSRVVTIHGRPGWHIECSAMSAAYLGEIFDIHGGGLDLIFPHHENEIAQSRCAFHTPVMANYWMHNGFLQVEGEKMSKSLGNFVTIWDLLRNWPGDVLRLNMLRTHYRQPIDWTKDGLLSALKDLQSWTELIALHSRADQDSIAVAGEVDRKIIEALADDLNTPLALSRLYNLFDLAKQDSSRVPDFTATLSALGFTNINKPGFFHPGFGANLFESGPKIGVEESAKIQLYRMAEANNFPTIARSAKHDLEAAGFVLKLNDAGVLFVGNKTGAEMHDDTDPEAALRGKIDRLIAERNAARAARNFRESDRIRDELAQMGVVLKDTKDGTTWEIAR